MLDFADLNWWAILVATAVAFALGAVWYGPLFGKAWLDAVGLKAEDIEPTPQPFIISAVAALLTCVVVAALLKMTGITGLLPGALFGLIVGIGFIATAMASDNAFCGWGLKLWLLQAGYRVTYTVVMGGILGVWP